MHETGMPVYADHIRWLWRCIAAEDIFLLLVLGAVDSGKSTFFTELCTHQPHAASGVTYKYLDLLYSPGAHTSTGFIECLTRALDLPGRLKEGLENLAELLETRYPDTRVVLVLDHWDQAQENYTTSVDLDGLQRLQQWVRTVQPAYRERSTSFLGLILVTRFPTTEMFLAYIRANGGAKPGLARASGYLDRLITDAQQFPFLSRERSITLVRTLITDNVNEVVDACGGWPGLLVAAARQVKAGSKPPDLSDSIGRLLGKSLLPVVAADLGNGALPPWLRIINDIHRGADPVTKYGLPVREDVDAVAGLRRLPDAFVDRERPPPLLLVDVEYVESNLAAWVPAIGAGGYSVPDITVAVQRHLGLPDTRVRNWNPGDGRLDIEDPRTQLTIVSNRAAMMVADPGFLMDVFVVSERLDHLNSSADSMPAHWRFGDAAAIVSSHQ